MSVVRLYERRELEIVTADVEAPRESVLPLGLNGTHPGKGVARLPTSDHRFWAPLVENFLGHIRDREME